MKNNLILFFSLFLFIVSLVLIYFNQYISCSISRKEWINPNDHPNCLERQKNVLKSELYGEFKQKNTPEIYTYSQNYGKTVITFKTKVHNPYGPPDKQIEITNPQFTDKQKMILDYLIEHVVTSSVSGVYPVVSDQKVKLFILDDLGFSSESTIQQLTFVEVNTADIDLLKNLKLKNLAILNSEEFANSVYGDTSIYSYSEKSKKLILHTRGGDGCGGRGILWTVDENGRQEILQNYGYSCANDKYRFGGRIGNKLVFAEVKSLDSDIASSSKMPYAQILNLFTIDLDTNQKSKLRYTATDKIYDLVSRDNEQLPNENSSIVVLDENGELNEFSLDEQKIIGKLERK